MTAIKLTKSIFKTICLLGAYFSESFVQSFISSGVFPQKLQFSPSLFKNGLWLAQVPENFPSFFAHILIAIPANAIASKPIVNKTSFIFSFFRECKFTKQTAMKCKKRLNNIYFSFNRNSIFV